jgi:hypothetical protein
MNPSKVKTFLCLALMISCVMQAFNTNDLISGKLFASLGILTGALASSHLTNTRIVEK